MKELVRIDKFSKDASQKSQKFCMIVKTEGICIERVLGIDNIPERKTRLFFKTESVLNPIYCVFG